VAWSGVVAKQTETSIDITSNYLYAQQSKGRRARKCKKAQGKKIRGRVQMLNLIHVQINSYMYVCTYEYECMYMQIYTYVCIFFCKCVCSCIYMCRNVRGGSRRQTQGFSR